MKAHMIEGGVVINTIEVESLDFMSGLVEATEGGLGWLYDGSKFTSPNLDEIASEQGRQKRNSLLAETDWTASSDITMSDAMKVYRQALRDVPSQSGFPTTINWPKLGD